MKILFIAPYRQNDEWGDASRNYIRSLLLTGHDITIRPIFFSNSVVPELSKDLIEAENKKCLKYDVLIQKCLPPTLEYHGKFDRNVGICTTESYNIHSTWVRHLNLMDEIWVTSTQQAEMFSASNIKTPIKIIGCPIPTDIFTQKHEPLDIAEAKDTCNFYYIGESSERSNLTATLIAFHTTFDLRDSVRLIINTGAKRDDTHNLITDIKKRLRIYSNESHYIKDVIVTPLINSKNEVKLHALGHCFVLASYGEAFQKYAVNAGGFNKYALVGPSMQEFVPDTNWVIKGQFVRPCIEHSPLRELYTGNEYWYEVSTYELGKMMQYVYEQWLCGNMPAYGTDFITNKCSYEAIAININKALS